MKQIQLFVPTFRTEECLEEIRECLEKGWTGLGFKTIQLEEKWKEYTGLPHAHYLNSATVGLDLAVNVLKEQNGWQDGDEIISTPMTFVSTNHAFLKNANNSKDAVVKEIRSYLPDSVTAGLAGAFNKKKEEENNERNVTSERFSKLIGVMLGIAFLPFVVYVTWLFQGKGLEEVIQKIPNMTIAVLPLYIPLIWLGIHFNRRINLSKKLIEEYAYKEAVCKSFAGLSEQIEAINDKKTIQELRLKLIDLVMSVNSENPGKYITQYDKCDNPAIELLGRLEKMKHLNIKAKGVECEVQMDKENTSSEQVDKQ